MANEIKDLLEERIRSDFENLSNLKPGSEEYTAAVASLEKLYKINIEELENERAFRARCDRNIIDERDIQIKAETVEEQRKQRWWSTAMQVSLTVGGWVAYNFWLNKGFKFEEEGTIRSPWLKSLVTKVVPKK